MFALQIKISTVDPKSKCALGWMNGQMDGRMDGWTDGRTDGPTNAAYICMHATKNRNQFRS